MQCPLCERPTVDKQCAPCGADFNRRKPAPKRKTIDPLKFTRAEHAYLERSLPSITPNKINWLFKKGKK